MSSLYERLGGDAAIEAAVDRFYRKVLADPRLKDFFTNVDMPRQMLKQRAFLTLAFGGPQRYNGRGMRAAHADAVKRGLSDVHFDAVVELLGATLQEMGVASDLIQEVAAIAETTRDDVLNRTPAQVAH